MYQEVSVDIDALRDLIARFGRRSAIQTRRLADVDPGVLAFLVQIGFIERVQGQFTDAYIRVSYDDLD